MAQSDMIEIDQFLKEPQPPNLFSQLLQQQEVIPNVARLRYTLSNLDSILSMHEIEYGQFKPKKIGSQYVRKEGYRGFLTIFRNEVYKISQKNVNSKLLITDQAEDIYYRITQEKKKGQLKNNLFYGLLILCLREQEFNVEDFYENLKNALFSRKNICKWENQSIKESKKKFTPINCEQDYRILFNQKIEQFFKILTDNSIGQRNVGDYVNHKKGKKIK